MYKAGNIPELVVAKLWQIYGVNKDISKAQRRGAIIVLGMIALADPNVVIRETDAMLRIGLGQLGRLRSCACEVHLCRLEADDTCSQEDS